MKTANQPNPGRKIYVIGHRNPDTDSIVSAVAYAALKRSQGFDCHPARAGKLTPQTEYILDRFEVPAPEFLADLQPKVAHFLSGKPATVVDSVPLWEALERMDHENLSVLPVVDAAGRYKAMLNHLTFARNITRKINPQRKAIVPTSINLLVKTLKAQPILVFNGDEVVKSRILVAGSSVESFKTHLETEIPANALVLVGDRADIARLSIERGARALVITNRTAFPKELRTLAEEHKVSVIVSAYDTSSTAFLILYSTPVQYMADDKTQPIHTYDCVRDIRVKLASSDSRCLPVVDDAGVVAGVFCESDLIKDPNIDIIMVDHNEAVQAVEGIDQFRILEIIDHHRLGNLSTRQPITFINRVVGSTSTIVAGMYAEQKVALTRPIAGILLSGILTDTLILRSATTTDTDRVMAEYLAGLLDLDVESYGREIFTNSNRLSNWTVADMLSVDSKRYTACGKAFVVCQVESGTTDELVGRSAELLKGLEARCKEEGLYFAALMITDITALNSVLLVAGDDAFIGRIPFPRLHDRAFLCKDILSRKKQLLPLLIEHMEGVLGTRDPN